MANNVKTIKSEQFEQEVLKSSLPVVVYFYSDDCLPCLNFGPMFEKVAAILKNQMKFIKIFRSQNRDLAEKYGVKTSPAVLFFKAGAEVCTRLVGYINSDELKKSIDNVLEKSCPETERTIVNCDVLIIGAGPAGLTSAIYTSRARLQTVVIESNLPGGQVATTYHVANYPGTNGVVRGVDLMENMKRQALDFGTQIDELQKITEVNLAQDHKFIKTDHNDYYAKAVIIATGAEPRKLPVPGEAEFRGRGIHYCATCDGALYQDADVMVAGGGTSAVQEAVFLTRYAKSVTIVNRSDKFKAAKSAVDDALKNNAIKVLWNSEIAEVKGEGFLKSVVIRNSESEDIEVNTDGVFVYIGTQPNSSVFSGHINLSDKGYIITDNNMAASVSGVFAAGDVREKEIRQISTAVGDGTIAGMMAEKYING